MNNLTATELNVLNNISRVHTSDVQLGTTVQNIINTLGKTGTPVNAVAASKLLTLTGVVIDGETVTIGTDVYEFLTDTAQTKTAPTNIPVDIKAHAVKASVTLTMPVQPTSGDKVTIGTKIYTFVPVGTDTADGEVSIGADLAGAQANLLAAINGTDTFNVAHPLVSAGEFVENVMPITAFVGGTVGNSIVSTETFTSGSNIFSAAHLENGANCSAANADGILIAAINASDTQGVTASQGTGTTVLLTADVAGVLGNSILIGETMANATFEGDAVLLSGGVNGTVGAAGQLLVDESYYYIAIAQNTISGANWRRFAVGNVY